MKNFFLFCMIFCMCTSLFAQEAFWNKKWGWASSSIKTPSVGLKKLDKALKKAEKGSKNTDKATKKANKPNKFSKFADKLNALTNEGNSSDTNNNASDNTNKVNNANTPVGNGNASSRKSNPTSKEEDEWPSDAYEDKPLPPIVDFAQNPEGAYRQFFDFLKAENIMVPRIIDPQGRVGKSAQLSIATVPDEDDELELSMGVLVDFDRKFYTKYFLPKLKTLLQNIADAEGEVTHLPPKPDKDVITTSIFNGAWKRDWCMSYRAGAQEGLPKYKKNGYILVNMAGRYNEKQNPFQYYKIKNIELFCKVLQGYRERQRKMCVSFALLDEDKNEIQAFDWTLYPEWDHDNQSYGDMYCFFFQTYMNINTREMRPMLIIDPCIIGLNQTRPFNVFEFKEKIKVKDLKDTRAMKLSFKYKN